MKKILLLFVLVPFLSTLFSQTTLIDPNGDGGFETGAGFAANGWTATVGTATQNQWVCNTGATSGFTGTRCAYVSNNSAGTPPLHTYTMSTARYSHIYRNISVPAGETSINLNFAWINKGETGYDYMTVWIVPTSYTPAYGTAITATGSAPTGRVKMGLTEYSNQSTWINATQISIPSVYAGAGNVRIVIEWKNDGSGGTNPPAGIDNISLVSQIPPPPICATGLVPANNASEQNWLGLNMTWSAAANATGYKLTFGSNAPDYNNLKNNFDLGNVLTYASGVLNPGTVYGWKIVPYNGSGEATGCTFNTYTTSNDLLMSTASVNFCSGNFYDSGGASNPYTANENKTLTICPSAGTDKVQVAFSSFDIESGYDYLYIYNGNSVGSPLIGTYTGTTSPGTVLSSAANGCLTFKFTSDVSGQNAGWASTVSCIPPASCPLPTTLTNTNIGTNSAELGWTNGGSETMWKISYGIAPLNDANAGTIVDVSSPPPSYFQA